MIGETISHYKIVDKIGEGGMGEVYLAEDTKLRRKVALKILPGEMASDPERLARFKREAETVAALSHPNIVTIHSIESAETELPATGHQLPVGTEDAGSGQLEADSREGGRVIHFLTMEWVEGKTLGELMSRGPLPLEKVFELAIPVADALASAHGKGITHRDLKPANIMVSNEGRVKILDFGLAKLHEQAMAADGDDQPTQAFTQEGLAVGTVPYMSPEQVRGEEVDQRSDIFSLGVVLYEITSGQRPFAGKSSADLVSAILRDKPPSVTQFNADLPHHLGRVIQRCMEKDPEKRFQTAKDVRNELEGLKDEVASGVARLSSTAIPAVQEPKGKPKWLVPAAAAAAVVVLGMVLWMMRGDGSGGTPAAGEAIGADADETTAAGATDRDMVIVLPFENLGPAEDAYFAAGIADEINGRLASVSGLGVISRKTAGRYADTEKSVEEIGDELGVDYVLGGTVRWARSDDGASRVRIAPELIRVADDTQIWTEIYDREIDDIFEVQSEIAGQVIDALGVSILGSEEQALEAQPTENMDAYQAYLKALDLQQAGTSLEDFDSAVTLFERAVELDPDFLEAWAELSRQHSSAYHGFDRTESRLARAKAALDGAERVAPDAVKTRWARGYYYYYGFRDYDRALADFEAAAQNVANDAEIQQAIAYIHRRKGDLEKTVRLLERASELDPQDANILRQLASTYRALRRPIETLEVDDQVLALEPENDNSYTAKAEHLRDLTGDVEAAREILEKSPGNIELAVAFGALGQLFVERDFTAIIERMESLESETPFIQAARAVVLASAKYLRDGPEAARSDLEAAVRLVDQVLETAPSNAQFHQWMASLYAFLGENDAAVQEAKLAVDLTAKDAFSGPAAVENLAATYGWVGRTDEALELIERLLGSTYESALTVHELRQDPIWDDLRDDPRLQELIEKHR